MKNWKNELPAALLAGAIWGVIPAIFKSKWQTNETLFTLMMNYVAMTLVSYFIMVKDKSGRSDLGILNERTGYGYLPNLFDRNYIFNILIVVSVPSVGACCNAFSILGYIIPFISAISASSHCAYNVMSSVIIE